jgi:hypothetical protein
VRLSIVYRRRDQYFIHASSKTTDGVWILSEPCLSMSADEGHGELGRRIVLALDGSRSGVPHPRDWKGLANPLLPLAGVKSWAAFSKSAACVEVAEEEGRITLTPTRNLGVHGGFEAEASRQILTTREDIERLGAMTAGLLGERT